MTPNHRPSYDNPFYHNYVFHAFDKTRTKITMKDKINLFFKTMYVQLNDGYEWYYKVGNDGRIYLFDVKEFKP